MVKTNIPQIRAELLAKASVAEGIFSDVTFAALNSAMALMKRRIFNDGLDAEGKRFGGYVSKQYREKRIKAGRRVDKKDLQFEGSLFASIQTRKDTGNRSVILFTTPQEAAIGGYQEEQIGAIRVGILPKPKKLKGRVRKAPPVSIFTLSTKERADASRVGNELLKQTLIKL